MTGFANKLNEPFSVSPTPQGVAPTGANASSNAPEGVSNLPANSALNATSRNRTVKSSIHDLEAWLPVRRTSTDAKTSVPAACMISAGPVPESLTADKGITVQTTEVQQPTREPTAPTLTNTPSIAAPSTSPDNEAPAMLGSGSAPALGTSPAPVERPSPAPTLLRCDPSPLAQKNPAPAAQTNPSPAAQTNSALSFLDIPPLECKTVFEKE